METRGLSVSIHSCVVVLILAVYDVLPPLTVVEIPLDRFLDAIRKLRLRQPAELVVYLCGVDSIAHVVTLAVGDMGDEALRLAERLADYLYDVDVLHLVVTADVVHLADSTLVDDQIDSTAVILNVQPVADIQTLAVNGERLVVQRVGYHQRNELLGEVVRTIVVGAPGYSHRQTEGPVVSLYQQVCARLGSGIRAGGVDRGLLGEEQVGSVERQVAVDLVGGNLVIALDAVLAAGVHHGLGADYVGVQEHAGVLNGAVNVALCREVYHDVGVFLLEYLENRVAVGNIHLAEAEVRVVHYGCEGLHVACVCEAVKADYPVLRVSLEHIVYEISADKAGAACYDYLHISSGLLVICKAAVAVLEERCIPVLIRYKRIGDTPVHAYLRVIEADASVALVVVVVVRLVQELHLVGQGNEAVAEAARNEQLSLVLSGKLNGYPLLVSRRPLAEVYCNVHYSALAYSDELCLRMLAVLEVDTAQNSLLAGIGMIVLNELAVYLRELPLGIALHEPTALIAENLRLNYIYALDISFYHFHFMYLFNIGYCRLQRA